MITAEAYKAAVLWAAVLDERFETELLASEVAGLTSFIPLSDARTTESQTSTQASNTTDQVQ